jgi:microcystin degradation protein MlrC
MTRTSPRVALLGLHLEANAFAPPTTLEDFQRQFLAEGDAVIADARAVPPSGPLEMAGFVAAMDAGAAWQPVGILLAAAPPGGPIQQPVLDGFVEILRSRLEAAMPLDAVYIGSHGATAATGDDDPDATIAQLVRGIVGPNAPVIGTLDLHANISQTLVDNTDALIGYRTNPHVDQRARGAEAASLLRQALAGERFVQRAVVLPFCPPTITMLTNEDGPMATLLETARALETGSVVSTTVLGGFPFTDAPRNGFATLAVARGGDRDAARAASLRLARDAWAMREQFSRRLMPLEMAANLARAVGDNFRHMPICLADVGDNPGGGGQGNSSALLAALHEAGAKGVLLGNFCDPALVADAHAAGEGSALHAVFNRVPGPYSPAFTAAATVERLSDGNGVGRRGSIAGRRFGLGPSALLRLEGSGMVVIACGLRRQLLDPAMVELFGIDVADLRTLVVKSRGHFRAGFDTWFDVGRIYEVDTPGLTSPVLERFTFRGLKRPVFPLDAEAAWEG